MAFWVEQARTAGNPVLELACGTGRLTLALAAAGVLVVGLDHDPVMLAAAAAARGKLELRGAGPLLVAADMRRFAFGRRFRLILVGYNSLQLLTGPGEMVACLKAAREHLAPAGLVGLEVTDFQSGGADGPDGAAPPSPLGEAEGIRLSGTLVHDLATRTSRYVRYFQGPDWQLESDVVVRSLDRAELEGILLSADLGVVRSWVAGTTLRVVAARRP